MNLQDYNKKLQKLIEEAEKDGYKLSDTGFIKTEDIMFPVMEVFFVHNTTCQLPTT